MDLNPQAAQSPAPAIHTCTAGSGFAWIRSGWHLFARQPLLIVVLVALGPMILMSIDYLPFFGEALAMMAAPALLIGMLNVCRSVEAGEVPGLRNYVSALRVAPVRLQLLKLGVYCAIVLAILAFLLTMLFGETRASPPASEPAASTAPANGNSARNPPQGTDASGTPRDGGATQSPPLTVGDYVKFAIRLAVVLPMQMAVWFAPPLIAWFGMPAEKAMFFSFFACWRNRAPIVVFLLAYFGLLLLALIAVGFLKDALGLSEDTTTYFVAPVFLTLLAINQTSTLAMVGDIVDEGSPRDSHDETQADGPAQDAGEEGGNESGDDRPRSGD